MMLAASVSDPERSVGFLAILLFSSYGVVKFYQFLTRRPAAAEPWGEQIESELADGEGTPVCHRCLTPHDPLDNFCSECGAPVGECTNLLPFPYLFSMGDTLRLGTTGEIRRSPLTVAGFIVFSVAEYAIFAPVYWFLFFRNFSRTSSENIGSTERKPDREI